jgi:DNA-binding NarL/FixJ family response regulator
MTKILIDEPHPLVRRMLERMVARLGHEPVVANISNPEQLASADVLLVELAAPLGITLAQAAQLVNPALPIVCASVTGPPPELAELGIELAGALVKPFTSGQLDAAIRQALAPGAHPSNGRPTIDRRAA